MKAFPTTGMASRLHLWCLSPRLFRPKRTGAVYQPVVPCVMRHVCSVRTILTLSAGFGGVGSMRWQGVLSLTTGAFTNILLLLKTLVVRSQMVGSKNP